MLLPKEKLLTYIALSDPYWFETRSGSDPVTSRNAYFEMHPAELIEARYCAIGNDATGYQLEQYLNQNWVTVNPDSNYNLVITTAGLKALADTQGGGYRLYISGLKIGSNVLTASTADIITWKDQDFDIYGNTVFSASTSTNGYFESNPSYPPSAYNINFNKKGKLNDILTWDFNSANGGLQYTLTLSPDNAGDTPDTVTSDSWQVGSIALYVKVQNPQASIENNSQDILFAVATLQRPVTKYITTEKRFGNKLIFYFNMILNNLGYVTNLNIIPQETCRIPEIANESIIENISYRGDESESGKALDLNPRNLYLVDNMYGTNIPAIAVPRGKNISGENIWSYIYPTDNFIRVNPDQFADNVYNYDFVCWDDTINKYVLANGSTGDFKNNRTLPMGLRIGNSIIFSGEVVNNTNSYSYKYNVTLGDSGEYYKVDDILLLPTTGNTVDDPIIIKVQVTNVSTNTEREDYITDFVVIGPLVGNRPIENNNLAAVYSPYSQYPQYGQKATFKVTSTQILNNGWNFSAEDINKPVYCGANGKPVVIWDESGDYDVGNDSFIGWCTGPNSIKLALDLRNEATTTRYGITRYASENEASQPYYDLVNPQPYALATTLSNKEIKDNYLQITKGNGNQVGDTLAHPIHVNTFTKFNEVIIGKGITPNSGDAEYSEATHPYITDPNVSFYGRAFRAMYQDIAEFYEADKEYEPGTLITFGGENEITVAINECNGIISEKPGYQLGAKKTKNHLPVALVGRVKVKMDGNSIVQAGDKIYLSKIKPGYASTVENGKCLGKIVSKCEPTAKIVECVVRIDF